MLDNINSSYPDVATTFWANNSINVMQDTKIMLGYSDGNFHPNQPITRGEMAAVILRYMNEESIKKTSYSFEDTTSHWAKNEIETLYEKGVMKGYPDGSFRPSMNLTRDEAVVIINKVLNRGGLYGNFKASWPDVNSNYWSYNQIEEASRNHEATRNSNGNEDWVRFLDK